MTKPEPYGKGTRSNGKDAMSRDQVLDAMRYLGWSTHDEAGTVTDEAFHVSRELAGKVTESVMLGSLIATAVDNYRASQV